MKVPANSIIVTALALGLSSAAGAAAQGMDHGKMGDMKMGPGMSGMSGMSGMQDMTDGEVRKVNKDAKKITIRHGEIKNLGMPAMTMVFQVKDLSLLDRVAPGDKVKFRADKSEGAMIVTAIEKVQ